VRDHLRQRLTAALAITVSSFGLLHPASAAALTPADPEVEATGSAATTASGWQIDPGLRLTVRAISTEASVQADDEIIEGDAFAFVVVPSLTLTNEDTRVTFRNAATRIEYRDETRADRWQNTARLGVRFGLGDGTSATLFGERSDNLFAAEFASAEEWEAGGELEHEFDAANRVQLGASWRERSYDDIERSNGDGLRVDAEYRYRFAANHYAFVRARYDRIGSDNQRRNLTRWRAEASYQNPIARDLRARGGLSYQRLDFFGRPLASGGVRQDDLFEPELALIYSPGSWRIAAEARYIVRKSTDPEFDRSGYRIELEVSHAF
jgi:hypothetical protein